ncbi:hypothetical protein RP20_CCG004475 [Aedes albopictus]|nr:hypothetical protein RP20_CCG004475 [Aedes albopictus]
MRNKKKKQYRKFHHPTKFYGPPVGVRNPLRCVGWTKEEWLFGGLRTDNMKDEEVRRPEDKQLHGMKVRA